MAIGLHGWILRIAAAAAALSPLAACHAATNSGIYMLKSPGKVEMIQLVEDQTHHVTGRLEDYGADAAGKVTSSAMTVEGMAADVDLSLMFKPLSFLDAGITASVHREGPVLTVVIRGITTTLRKTDLASYQVAVQEVASKAAATRAQIAAATAPKLPANSAPPGMPPVKTSFDCAKASLPVEHLVCQNLRLASFDRTIGYEYGRLLAHSNSIEITKIRNDQRNWIFRRNQCQSDDCLMKTYISRVRDIGFQLAKTNERLRANVREVGNCEMTSVDELSHRFVDDPTSGSVVGFANGANGVSYDIVPEIAASRIGDRAKVCLVSIPKDCPAGDDRGRVYGATNMRTGGHWELPDSQHGCGA
jgi:uncharacterized protein